MVQKWTDGKLKMPKENVIVENSPIEEKEEK
jgi:hypothetical protein